MNDNDYKKHGGIRPGSGRPKGSGKFKSKTKTVRVPVNLEDKIFEFIDNGGNSIPLYSSLVQAGIPSSIESEIAPEKFDLYNSLITNPDSSFMVRATGESMRDVGIFDGDIMIVDKSVECKNGSIVVAMVNGDFTVKRFWRERKNIMLLPENEEFDAIHISGEDDFKIIGSVTHSFRNLS